MGNDPPTLVLGHVAERPGNGHAGSVRTHQDLLETEECVVHIVSEWFVEATHRCSLTSADGSGAGETDGLKAAGFTGLPFRRITPIGTCVKSVIWNLPLSG